MFIVNNHRISFRKSYSLILSKNKGRYDTVCTIETEAAGRLYKGTAYLHPKDSPNRIIGKKIALTKALTKYIRVKELPNGTKQRKIVWHMDKHDRTIIWKAFWKWVESWKKKEPVKMFDNIEEVKK